MLQKDNYTIITEDDVKRKKLLPRFFDFERHSEFFFSREYFWPKPAHFVSEKFTLIFTKSDSNCQLCYVDRMENFLRSLNSSDKPQKLYKFLDALFNYIASTLYYIHLTSSYSEVFRKYIKNSSKYEIVVETEGINTYESKQVHFIIRAVDFEPDSDDEYYDDY